MAICSDSNQMNEDYIRIIKRLSYLLPIECKDKLMALEEIIVYVSSMLYGDDLHQFCTYNYYKKYVITALDELVVYVQEHSLTQCRSELELLREEINKHLLEKEQYLNDIKKLKSEKELLQEQIDVLKKENELLSNENKSVKASVDEYSAMMKKLVGNNQVVWEVIKENDPIYAITPNTINSYICELKKAYMCKLGVSEQECESDFMLNSSGLYELRKLLSSFQDRNNYNTPISHCIANYRQLGVDYFRGISLDNLMKKIKLPKIIERAPTLPIVNLTDDSENLNGLVNKLYYQKIAFEALAKQRIAEAQLYSLIMILKQIAPDYDLSQIFESLEIYSFKYLQEGNDQGFAKKR